MSESDPRWTPSTEQLITDKLLTLAPDDARAVLTVLADAGKLVTPRTQAVLDAARAVVDAGQYPGEIRAAEHAQRTRRLTEALGAYVAEQAGRH
jgi:hypothetical protein